jgi:hypothetical protein
MKLLIRSAKHCITCKTETNESKSKVGVKLDQNNQRRQPSI